MRANTTFADVVRAVASLKPGQCVSFDRYTMREIPTFEHKGFHFSAADRVLENVVGSAYGWTYLPDPLSGSCSFERMVRTEFDGGRRTYVSPDYRHLYRRTGAVWIPISRSAS